MEYYLREWLILLRGTESLAAAPLALGGLILMFGGYRLWKVAVILTFGVLGAILGVVIGQNPHDDLIYGGIGFLLAAVASFPPVYYAVAVLGGIIGGGILAAFALSAGLSGPPLWLLGAVGLIAASALSYIHLRQVIIIVTAFEGAMLLLSGIVAVLSKTPGIFNFFKSMAYDSSIFVPFLVMVPTVIGYFMQEADAKQRGVAISRA